MITVYKKLRLELMSQIYLKLPHIDVTNGTKDLANIVYKNIMDYMIECNG